MNELEILYKDLQERKEVIEAAENSITKEGRIAENLLTIIRVQELLLQYKMRNVVSLKDIISLDGDNSPYNKNTFRGPSFIMTSKTHFPFGSYIIDLGEALFINCLVQKIDLTDGITKYRIHRYEKVKKTIYEHLGLK